MQTIIATALLIMASAYLGWKYIGKKLVKSPEKEGPCGPDCNCS